MIVAPKGRLVAISETPGLDQSVRIPPILITEIAADPGDHDAPICVITIARYPQDQDGDRPDGIEAQVDEERLPLWQPPV